jgi:VIT1/CCC1 family predicted Fe2+/Mn2+ transporter
MGAGDYVSVSSQADTERADLNVEKNALLKEYYSEQEELRDIYISQDLDHALAWNVASQLLAHDALGAHARDEIGITDALTARPMQASATSAISFATGGSFLILAHVFAPSGSSVLVISTVSLISLAVLGVLAAHAGGASLVRGAVRVLLWERLRWALPIRLVPYSDTADSGTQKN